MYGCLAFTTRDTEALVFELAVGEDHTINVDSSNFLGSKDFNIPRGGPHLSVPVREKIVIPDADNGRIVMIDDMAGTDWSETSVSANYRDVEVGSDGRDYVAGGAELTASDTAPRVVRVDPESGSVAWVNDTLPVQESSPLPLYDVLYHNGSVYVTSFAGTDGYKIVQLDAWTGEITGRPTCTV